MDLVSLLTSTTSKETPNPNAWDVSKAYYDAGADAWDISKTVYRNATFNVSTQDNNPQGIFFKPDGTKMYYCGSSSDDVFEYTLSTPWLVSSASYVQNFDVGTKTTVPASLFFKPDGTKMYVTGSAEFEVFEYDLSTPWDISTSSYNGKSPDLSGQGSNQGLFFKPDGTKMYLCATGNDDVNEYDLGTPWNVSTASFARSENLTAQETSLHAVFFKPDGTKMYVTGVSSDAVHEYNLSVAWRVTSSSFVQSFSVAAQDDTPRSLFFDPNGGGFYILGGANDTVYQYTIGGFSVATEETVPTGLFFKPDGTKMYIVGQNGDDVNEYDLSTAWDITTASYLQNFSVSAQDTSPEDLFFKPDGTKMYIVGSAGDDVNEYSLSSAWDVSTASYVQNFSVSSQETAPNGLFFKPDGTKMYVIGQTGDDVNEYDLSSAWDISTASYLQNFSVATEEATPQGLFFKPDGTKMYIVGQSGDDVNEYDLSTPWDISTASYVQNFLLEAQALNPGGVFFKPDGSQFFIVSPTSDKVFSYLISPT